MNKPTGPQLFSTRLAAAREADEVLNIKSPKAALNGQISAADEELSAWNNYDRYFKFGSIARS
jgi:hypothetical protein